MIQQMTPASAVTAPLPTAVGAGPILPIPSGYVRLDDTEALQRMLRNIADNAALLAAVKEHHTLDAGGPLLMAFTRLVGMEEAEAIEVRHIRNLLGGA